MGYFTKRSVDKYKGQIDKKGVHIKCGTVMRFVGTGRSIWNPMFTCAGSGEVRQVAELYCPKCDGDKEPPTYGSPIYENEVVEL